MSANLQTPLARSPSLVRLRLSRLSAREFEVFIALAAGERVAAISQRLALSVKTVSTYRARVFDKLALYSNAALAELVANPELMEAERTRTRRTGRWGHCVSTTCGEGGAK